MNSYLLSHPNFTYSGISCCYPLKEYQLNKYRQKLPWAGVVLNKNIIWTEEMGRKYLPEILTTIQGDQEVDEGLECCENPTFPWDVVEDYMYQLNWFFIAHNPVFIANDQLVNRYWNYLSDYAQEVEYTRNILKETPGVLPQNGWWQLENNNLPDDPASINRRMINFIFKDEHALLHPEAVVWTKETIAQYEKYIDWQALSSYADLPWDEQLIIRYADKWDRRNLLYNKKAPVSLKVLEALQLKDGEIWNTGRVWKEVFAEYMDDDKVHYLLEKILGSSQQTQEQYL